MMTEIDYWRAENDVGYYDDMPKETTPCDTPDNDGVYRCPYADTYTGYESEMCRVCCGLGVDE